jgi:hypothetical protein
LAMTNRQVSRFARPQVARRVEHKDVRHEIQRFEDDVRRAVLGTLLRRSATCQGGRRSFGD